MFTSIHDYLLVFKYSNALVMMLMQCDNPRHKQNLRCLVIYYIRIFINRLLNNIYSGLPILRKI